MSHVLVAELSNSRVIEVAWMIALTVVVNLVQQTESVAELKHFETEMLRLEISPRSYE